MKLLSVCIFAKLIKGALFVSYCLDPSRRMTLKENSRNTVRHWDDFERKIREISRKIREIPSASVARKTREIPFVTIMLINIRFYSTRHNQPDQHSSRFASAATRLKTVSYFSRQAVFGAELRSSDLPGCDWLAGLENTLNCRQYCRQICGSSNTISLEIKLITYS